MTFHINLAQIIFNFLEKAYTYEELSFISDLAKRYNLLVLSDEAAQWYIYDEPHHTRIG